MAAYGTSVEVSHGVMVLIDTSVWIPFLAAREPFADRLEDIGNHRRIEGHP